MNLLKALFGGSEESPEEKKKAEDGRRFDVFKYDGVRAAKMGQHEYAVKCYTEALKIRDDLETRDYLAQALIQTGHPAEALEQLRVLAEAEPDNAAIQRQIAVVAHMAEDYATMEQACVRALELDGDDPMAHYLAAQACIGRGDMVGAIARLTKALTIKDDFAEARLLRGQTLLGMGDAASAGEDATRLAEEHGDNEDVLLLLARVKRASGEADAAIELYGKVIDVNPFRVEAYKERGAIKYDKGDMRGAHDDAAKALELEPDGVKGVTGDYSAEGVEQKVRQAYSNLNPLGI